MVSLCCSRLPCVAGNAMFVVWPLAPRRPRASTVWCGRGLADDDGRCFEDDVGLTALFLILMFTLVAFSLDFSFTN